MFRSTYLGYTEAVEKRQILPEHVEGCNRILNNPYPSTGSGDMFENFSTVSCFKLAYFINNVSFNDQVTIKNMGNPDESQFGDTLPFSATSLDTLNEEIEPLRVSEWEMKKYKEMAARFGISVEDISFSLWRRLAFLDKKTKTCMDEAQAIAYARDIFEYLKHSSNPLSSEELKHIVLATILTDIGKTGPLHATKKEQQAVKDAITDIYAIDDKFDVSKSLGVFLETFITETDRREEIKHVLEEKMGINTSISFREFINLHAGWTYDLLKYGDASSEVLVSAANHHMLEGVNPHNIYNEDTGEIHYGSMRRPIDRREVFVILLDKYDANRRRGGATHENAIAYLESVIENKDREGKIRSSIINTIFTKQPGVKQLFVNCIVDLDAALKDRKTERRAA